MHVSVEHLKFQYGNQKVLDDVTASIEEGRLTCIVGPNGAGKSTMIKCMARLLKPTEGVIFMDGCALAEMEANALARCQAYVPQSGGTTFPLTVEELAALGRKPYVRWSLGRQDQEKIDETLEYLDLDKMRGKYLDELSGGERQRAMLARALVQEPKILLLDEPTSALDVRNQLEVMNLLREIARDRDCAVVLVMHDLMLVSRYADQAILLKDGCIFAHGSSREVLTAENIRAVYHIEAQILDTPVGLAIIPLDSIKGEAE